MAVARSACRQSPSPVTNTGLRPGVREDSGEQVESGESNRELPTLADPLLGPLSKADLHPSSTLFSSAAVSIRFARCRAASVSTPLAGAIVPFRGFGTASRRTPAQHTAKACNVQILP